MYDVIIIGAGVSGAASAREISRYKVRACVLEKEEDVCCGTSKANSAIVHAGYDAKNGSLMAKLNVEGSKMMAKLAKDLDFEFIQNGSLVVCTEEGNRPELEALLEQGRKNGVEGLRIVEREELLAMEPNISDGAVAALYAPTGGIVCPFNLNIALAENAFANGVEFQFNTEVEGIERLEGGFRIKTNQGVYEAKCVVNAAGVYADNDDYPAERGLLPAGQGGRGARNKDDFCASQQVRERCFGVAYGAWEPNCGANGD